MLCVVGAPGAKSTGKVSSRMAKEALAIEKLGEKGQNQVISVTYVDYFSGSTPFG